MRSTTSGSAASRTDVHAVRSRACLLLIASAATAAAATALAQARARVAAALAPFAGAMLCAVIPVLALLAPLGCGGEIPGVAARGIIAGKHVETTVDSDDARYLLARHTAGSPVDPRVEARIERARQMIRATGARRGNLARIARDFSPDLAALLIAEDLLHDARNARMQAGYLEELDDLEAGRAVSPAERDRYTVLFAPGWLYRSHPEHGAGFERQLALAARMGIGAERIPTDENASVEGNARIIVEEILRRRGDGRRYILASASKSGAEVAVALAALAPGQAGHLAAWINIGGVLGGTPLADDALKAPRCWAALVMFGWREGGLGGLRSMATAARRERLAGLDVPAHVLVVNYVPLPLSGDVTKPARDGYERMRQLGPNDGLALTTDEIYPGGATIVEAGLDHYLTAPDIDRRTAALINVVIRRLGED